MRKSDVEIGASYAVNISGRLHPVTILSKSPRGGWIGRNKRTGGEVRIRDATRLRRMPKSMYGLFGPATPPTDLTSPRKTPSERGITIAYIRVWRKQQKDAGKDTSIEAFYGAHGLCPACRGGGGRHSDETKRLIRAIGVPYPERKCGECGGTGLAR